MRTIKFRAWDSEYKIMAYPKEEIKVSGDEGYAHLNQPFDNNSITTRCDVDLYEKSPCVLLQYIGLKDKNGEEIYEGDIVKIGSGADELIEEIKWIQEKEWMKGECPFAGFVNHDAIYKCGVEVIGNIYENPELLK